MKKKISLILSMIVCVFSLAACGSGEKKPMIEDPHLQLDNQVNFLCEVVVDEGTNAEHLEAYDAMMIDDRESISQSIAQYYGIHADFDVLLKGMHSYADSYKDLRDNELAQKIRNLDTTGTFVPAEAITYEVTDDSVVAEVHFKTLEPENGGHDGIIEIIYDKNLHVTSITVNTVLGLDESMRNAAVNTGIGMGTVFLMLIIIAIIISLLKYVPSIVDSFKAKPEEQNKESVEKAIEGIVKREEAENPPADESDDTELVAVIAAAIAASEGAASIDGFVVRSIRRLR